MGPFLAFGVLSLTGDLVTSVKRASYVYLTMTKWWEEFRVILTLGDES